MAIPFSLSNVLTNSAFSDLMNQSGTSNTNPSLDGGSQIIDSATANTTDQNPGKTDNSSSGYNTENNTTNGNSNLLSQSGSDPTGGLTSPHSNNQWLGKSLRAPMSNVSDPDQNTPSKNIFFKFAGDENASIPGVQMWINPNQFTISHSKKIQEQVTRAGFVIFHWGDELDEIAASGISGSFARLNCPDSNNGMGYTGSSPDFGLDRRDTWPYFKFMQLLALYRNNGIALPGDSTRNGGGFTNQDSIPTSALSLQNGTGPSTTKQGTNNRTSNVVTSGKVQNAEKARRPTFAGIELHYDDNIFTGYFTSFTWSERAEDPFKFGFDFKFKILNTVYNKVFAAVVTQPNQKQIQSDLLANFQIPRFGSL